MEDYERLLVTLEAEIEEAGVRRKKRKRGPSVPGLESVADGVRHIIDTMRLREGTS